MQNAIKYTEKGNITLKVKIDKNKFVFSVKDTGIGIAAKVQNIIFDRFTREENAKKLYDGTGLGLAICKSIIDK